MGIAAITQHPGMFMAMMADRSAAFKALLGRMVYSGGAQRALGEAAVGGAEVLNPSGPSNSIPLSNISRQPIARPGVPLSRIPEGMNGVRG